MLKRLHIQNYAIIDDLEIDFSSHLNVITGETGAGKSILMGALSLILGERADSSVLLNKTKKCFVEGYFIPGDKTAIQAFLKNEDIEPDEEIVLRREIGSNGKSRGFINDTPATLQQLKALASLLVDLHQQFDTLELGDTDFQREVTDAMAENEPFIRQYQETYSNWQLANKELKFLEQQKTEFNKEYDYNRFLHDELLELNLADSELENLEQEIKLLTKSEEIKAALAHTCYELNSAEKPVVQLLKQLYHELSPYTEHHKGLAVLATRLHTTQVELQDIATELENICENVNFDQPRVEWINERLTHGYKLQKKHGVKSTNELRAIQNELGKKLEAVLNIDGEIAVQEKSVSILASQVAHLAEEISVRRQQAIKPLEENINGLLEQVGMPNARIKIKMDITDTWDKYGSDQIEFLFDGNKSNRFESLSKVASGGELSRLMLCIKSLVAEKIDLPTMIFDEIDTGISGEAAKQVGIIMKQMAAQRQIICITHQPQIAGKADKHLFVYKEIRDDAIKTSIRNLDADERITAIAKMLSGEKPTAAAMENAREMMN
ncbi:MAG: recN [Chitinophagaceae bacterium]|nr:recN [Chitinophagaceae bacterium]